MKNKNVEDECLKDAITHVNSFGLMISPKRLTALISNCKADYLPMCITKLSTHLLIAIEVDHFEDGVMNVDLKTTKGDKLC